MGKRKVRRREERKTPCVMGTEGGIQGLTVEVVAVSGVHSAVKLDLGNEEPSGIVRLRSRIQRILFCFACKQFWVKLKHLAAMSHFPVMTSSTLHTRFLLQQLAKAGACDL